MAANTAARRAATDLGQFGFLLGRAYYTYIVFLERRIEQAGLAKHVKPGMGSFLFALFRADNRTISELARELHVAKSTMTGVVARMRKAGLITVETCTGDSRAMRLKLTPLARSLEPRCRKLADEVERLLTRGLKPAQCDEYREFLNRMIDAMTSELKAARRIKPPVGRRRPPHKSSS